MALSKKEYIHKNLTGNSAHTLFARNARKDILITGMTLTNVHDSDTVYVDLFLRKKYYQRQTVNGVTTDWDRPTNTFTDLYIMKDIEITQNNTLILEPREVDYNSREYNLMIQLDASDSAVDINMNFRQEK